MHRMNRVPRVPLGALLLLGLLYGGGGPRAWGQEKKDTAPPAKLKELLQKVVPTASITPIPGSGTTIILTGNVAHAEDVETVLRIASSMSVGVGSGNIISALRVGSVLQVQLDVVVALVARDEVR